MTLSSFSQTTLFRILPQNQRESPVSWNADKTILERTRQRREVELFLSSVDGTVGADKTFFLASMLSRPRHIKSTLGFTIDDNSKLLHRWQVRAQKKIRETQNFRKSVPFRKLCPTDDHVATGHNSHPHRGDHLEENQLISSQTAACRQRSTSTLD